jgi:hypothetical protein
MATYPLINGIAYDWSSVEIDFEGQIYVGVTELTYSDNLTPGPVYGTTAQKLARTRGEYTCEASATFNLADGQEFIAALGDGFGEVVFNVTVMYQEPVSEEVITHRLIGARIDPTEAGGSRGPDPLQMTHGLDLMYIDWNGYKKVAGMLT